MEPQPTYSLHAVLVHHGPATGGSNNTAAGRKCNASRSIPRIATRKEYNSWQYTLCLGLNYISRYFNGYMLLIVYLNCLPVFVFVFLWVGERGLWPVAE